jgi:hypothetical protein
MKRTFWVYVLFVLALVAGLFAVWQTLQFMGFAAFNIPFLGTEFKVFLPSPNWFVAIMEGFLAAIWFWAAKMVWNLEPGGWLFMVSIAAINLIFAFLAAVGGGGGSNLGLYAFVNFLALILGLLPSTKKAFGLKP